MTEAIRLENVTAGFRAKVVIDDVSLVVNEGESIALIGPSGAGKTTLLGIINGTVVPERGDVWVLGKNLDQLSSRERRALCRRVGTIYQDLCLVDSLRVVHNVNAGNLGRWSTLRALCSLVWPLERPNVHAALNRVGIAEKIFEKTSTLSGGQQQRVAIARLLIQDPAIVLADEPVSSLDPHRGREVMDLLRRLTKDLGRTLVASCHSIEFARTHFDRIVGIREGRLCLDCVPGRLSDGVLHELYSGTDAPRLDDAQDDEVRLQRLRP
jgi:phosphonate transport system ATP-binding protein